MISTPFPSLLLLAKWPIYLLYPHQLLTSGVPQWVFRFHSFSQPPSPLHKQTHPPCNTTLPCLVASHTDRRFVRWRRSKQLRCWWHFVRWGNHCCAHRNLCHQTPDYIKPARYVWWIHWWNQGEQKRRTGSDDLVCSPFLFGLEGCRRKRTFLLEFPLVRVGVWHR